MIVIAEPTLEVELDEPLTRFTAEYPYAPEAAALSRWLVDAALASWELFELIDNSVLVASELVTNAVQTCCRRKLGFSIERLGEALVRIEVSDGSCSLPVFVDGGLPTCAERASPRGRGLLVVDRLSHRWGIELCARGKTVWAELRPGRRPR
ncbi:ATP-binding protein [Kitasatospora sp. NPDC127116]|uniref:ATP-binding protein n=1 Tax=Kitasatospora sp. NPDC127116 TaxID=3345367 RepID=UPI00363DBA67